MKIGCLLAYFVLFSLPILLPEQCLVAFLDAMALWPDPGVPETIALDNVSKPQIAYFTINTALGTQPASFNVWLKSIPVV